MEKISNVIELKEDDFEVDLIINEQSFLVERRLGTSENYKLHKGEENIKW